MHVQSQTKTIDQALGKALHSAGANGSVFQWYLALQFVELAQQHAKNEVTREYNEPYPSINLPSAPKASLYSYPLHYKQSHAQSSALHLSSQPALSIQLYNCFHPSSLQWSINEQLFSREMIENCPLHVQKELTIQKNERDTQDAHSNAQEDFNQSHYETGATLDTSIDSHLSPLPSDSFVDTMLENTAKAAGFVVS